MYIKKGDVEIKIDDDLIALAVFFSFIALLAFAIV